LGWSIKHLKSHSKWPVAEIFALINVASFERELTQLVNSTARFKLIDASNSKLPEQLQWLAEFEQLDIAFDSLESAVKLATLQRESWATQHKVTQAMAELANSLSSATTIFITWLGGCLATHCWPAWAVMLQRELQANKDAKGVGCATNSTGFCAEYDVNSFISRIKQLRGTSSEHKVPERFQIRCDEMGLTASEQRAIISSTINGDRLRAYFAALVPHQKSSLQKVRLAESDAWSTVQFSFEQAIDIILACVSQLDSRFASEIYQAFSQGRIKNCPALHSQAFCMDSAKGSFISVSFNGGLSDLALLAHECGHLVHQQAVRAQFVLAQGVDLVLSESIAIFFESWVVKQWGVLSSNQSKAIAWQYHQDIEWQHRHQMLAAFELTLYRLTPLTAQAIDRLWVSMNQRFYGDSVSIDSDVKRGWLELHHIVNAPFYFLIYPRASRQSKEYLKEPEIVVDELLKMLGTSDGRNDTSDNCCSQGRALVKLT